MKKMRRLIGVMLIVCFVMSYMPAVQAAEIIHSGKSGDIDWSIDSEGCLTLSGNGNYQKNEWRQYASEVKTARINIGNITDLSLMLNNGKSFVN